VSGGLANAPHALLEEDTRFLTNWRRELQSGMEKMEHSFSLRISANVSFLSAILKPTSLVIADKYVHRSIIDGIKLSGAKLLRYQHGDLAQLEKLLQTYQKPNFSYVTVTESVFSMHGTKTDVPFFL